MIFIGVPTTTDIAFTHGTDFFLERMSLLAGDGCGVRTEADIPVGTSISIVFRLSSALKTVRCKATVLAQTATTPAGLRVLEKHGQDAFDQAMDVGESVTRMVRLDQLEKTAPVKGAKKDGLCLQFVGLDAVAKATIAAHLSMSQKKLAAEPTSGAKWRNQADIGALFDEDSNLSEKAKDW